MFNKLFLSLSILFFSSLNVLFSQSNFVAGSIEKANGEIINGEIDYQRWLINPRKVKFKADNNVKEQTFTSKDLKAFKIKSNGETYISAIVKVDDEPWEDEKLETYKSMEEARSSFSPKTDTVFLLTLVKGKINLYELHDEQNKVHYYAEKDNKSIDELIFRRYKVYHQIINVQAPTKLTQIVESFEYRDQLNDLFSDAKVKIPTHSVRYSYSIVELVKEYNSKQGGILYVRKALKAPFYMAAFVGVNKTNALVKGFYDGTGRPIGKDFTPIIGLSMAWDVRGVNHDLRLGLEFAATIYSLNDSTGYNFLAQSSRYTFKSPGFKLTPYASYYFKNIKQVRPYAKLGVTALLLTNTKLKEGLTDSYSTVPSYNELKVTATDIGLHLGVGVKYKNYYLEGNYELGNNLIKGLDREFSINRFMLVVGYNFMTKIRN